MNNEFKKVKNNSETRYVLETATAGATSAGSVASVTGTVGKVQKRGNILAQEANKKKEAPKPRNFVAKNAKMGGAGKMQDKSKTIPRKEKHKKPVAEGIGGLGYDAQSLITKLRRDVEEKRLKPTPEAVLAAARELAGDMEFAPQLLVKQVLGQGVAEGYYDLPNQGNVPGMEPIDFSSKPSFKELITRYTQLVYQGHASETSPEEDQEYDAIEKYVAQRFGEKGSAHLQKAGEVSYWGRNDKPYGRDSRSSNLGRPNQPSGDFRTTKAGKMHGQDAKMMKAKVADRLGRHPEPNLPEGFNGEYDDEAGMAHSNLLTTARAVMGLLKTIKDRDNLPEWGQEKIAKAEMMLVSVWDYLQSQKELGNDPQVDMEEGAGMPFRGVGGAFNRGDDERHDLDPTDWYFVKDGKMFAISVYPNQEQEATARGYSRTRDEAKAKAIEQGMTENFGNYYNENIASKVFSQNPDMTSEDDVLNAAWEHVVRDMGRKKAGHLFNYDEDFPSDLVSSYFYLQKQKQSVAEGSYDLRSAVLSVLQDIYNGARAGEEMIDTVADELGDYFQDVKRDKDKTLRQAYQFMRQEGGDAEGNPEMMAQVAKQAIDMLSQQGVAEVDTYMESLAESLQQVLSEKAVSKKQQKFMGMVHAAQKGEKPASKEVAKVAKDMGKKDAKDFASTKHKGLPEKKKSKK